MDTGGLAIGKEESLFLTLNQTIGLDHYLLKFRYFVFTANRPRCETVNIDLAIAPLVRSQSRINDKKDICRSRLATPSALPLANVTVVPLSSDRGDYIYQPSTMFAVAASTLPPGTIQAFVYSQTIRCLTSS